MVTRTVGPVKIFEQENDLTLALVRLLKMNNWKKILMKVGYNLRELCLFILVLC